MVGWHAVKRRIDNSDAFGRISVYQVLIKGTRHIVPPAPVYNDIFRDISQKTNISSQLLLVSDAMGPNDHSCMVKQKEK